MDILWAQIANSRAGAKGPKMINAEVKKNLKRLNNGFTVWLGGRCVRKLFGRVLVPVFWLGCFRVLDFLPLVPVGGLLVVGVVNLGRGVDRGTEVGQQRAVVHHLKIRPRGSA